MISIRRKLISGGLESFSSVNEWRWFLSDPNVIMRAPLRSVNIAGQYHELRQRKAKLKSHPYLIQMEGTNLCNLNCGMCYRKLQNRPFGQMSIDEAKSILSGFPALTWVSLGGWGEPFMCRDLFDIIDYCNHRGIGVGLITNGTLIDDKAIEHIANSRILRVGISVDSVTPDTIRDYGDFENVRGSIRRLSRRLETSRRVPLRLVVTVMEENVKELGNIVSFAREVGVNHVHLHGVGIYNEETEGTPFGHADFSVLVENLDKAKKMAKEANVRLTEYSVSAAKKQFCNLPWVSSFITWNGDVHPCCSYLEKTLGNLNTRNFSEIWNSAEYQEFRANMARGNYDEICVKRCGVGK